MPTFGLCAGFFRFGCKFAIEIRRFTVPSQASEVVNPDKPVSGRLMHDLSVTITSGSSLSHFFTVDIAPE